MEEEPVDAQEPPKAAAGAAPPPSYCMLDLVNSGKSIHYAFMYNGKRFYVTISADKLRGKGALLDRFTKFTEDLDDLEAMFQFEDWVLGALVDFIAKVAPAGPEQDAAGDDGPEEQRVTLLEFFGCATYALEMVNDGGELRPVELGMDPRMHVGTSPRTRIIDPLPAAENGHTEGEEGDDGGDGQGHDGREEDRGVEKGDAEEEEEEEQNKRQKQGKTEKKKKEEEEEEEKKKKQQATRPRGPSIFGRGGNILRSALPKVPCILASELERVDDDGPVLMELSDVPKKVRRIGTDQLFFFKAAFKHQLRELELLEQIHQNSSMFVPPFRTSRLAGLVLWDDDESALMGFLLEYVGGRTLAASMQEAHPDQRVKWVSEVEVTLRRLHECGIVWGAVTPDSVLINADGDAVIVDLGGAGLSLEYAAPEVRQTVRGDMLGLEHMRMELGLIDQSLYSATLSH
ncbi:Protein kinase C-like 3 [Escovopsis weberi]|uniref:Protein kinase C-like 3 n=1 Tax=Escovopsis weberi TaxID=150374 RepID=A0A0M8N809_ESCWE|nr:Protein kinase C-like 3 [Escovopsis weberi]